MERGHLWTRNFRTILGVLERIRPGLTDELAASSPAPGCASPAWLLGHLIRTRYRTLAMLGSPQGEGAEWEAHYSRGGDGITVHLPFSALCEAFQATDGAMKEAFRAIEDWDRPTLNPGLGIDQPLEQVVAFFFWHESYHLGQIGWARKLLGLPGAF